MSKYKQFGKNIMYPDEIETWRLGEEPPDWIINICKLKMDKNYKPVPDIIPLSGGGYELVGSGIFGGTILKTFSNSDYIGKDVKSNRIFSLSEEGLNLMYKIKE